MYQLHLFSRENDSQYSLLEAEAVRRCHIAWLASMVRDINRVPKGPNQFGAGSARRDAVVQTWD